MSLNWVNTGSSPSQATLTTNNGKSNLIGHGQRSIHPKCNCTILWIGSDSALRKQAVQVAQRWVFQPATLQGRPVRVKHAILLGESDAGFPPVFQPGGMHNPFNSPESSGIPMWDSGPVSHP